MILTEKLAAQIPIGFLILAFGTQSILTGIYRPGSEFIFSAILFIMALIAFGIVSKKKFSKNY